MLYFVFLQRKIINRCFISIKPYSIQIESYLTVVPVWVTPVFFVNNVWCAYVSCLGIDKVIENTQLCLYFEATVPLVFIKLRVNTAQYLNNITIGPTKIID